MRDELRPVRETYEEKIERLGKDAVSVGHGDPDKQLLRYRKLTYAFRRASTPISVNDYGSGYGGFYRYLDQHTDIDLGTYNCYDISEKMLDEARETIESEDARFHNDDEITTEADVSIACMTFHDSHDNSNEEWNQYMKDAIENMYEMSTSAIGFTALTTYVDYEKDNLYYADPREFFHFCKSNLSDDVTLLHDYGLYEWTIVAFKDST